jgi:hypothetical protein
MKLSTNYTINANISHVGYYTGDNSFTFYTEDDEQIEIYGASVGNVICFARNFLVVDLKGTPKARLDEHKLRNLNEIKNALTEYLKEETDEATK